MAASVGPPTGPSSSLPSGGAGGLEEKLNTTPVKVGRRYNTEFIKFLQGAESERFWSVDVDQLNHQGKNGLSVILFTILRDQTKSLLDGVPMLGPAHAEHRFSDIDCIAETALEVEGGVNYPYIHANFVRYYPKDFSGKVKDQLEEGEILACKILAQCPTETVETQELFWRAALENSNIIVDLTRPNDPVEAYFPKNVHKEGSDVGKRVMGDITVECKQVANLDYGVQVHQYQVHDNRTGKDKAITRIHYSRWQDHSGIKDEDLDQIQFLKEVEDSLSQQYSDSSRPSIVHCRAGVGRSGSYTAASVLTDLKKKGLLTKDNYLRVIRNLVLAGRRQRGKYFVQRDEQLETLIALAKKLTSEDPKPSRIDFKLELPEAEQFSP